MQGFGQHLGGPQNNPQAMQQQMMMQQKLAKMMNELKILKKGGPEAEALIKTKVAEGKPPPKFEELMMLAQQMQQNLQQGQQPSGPSNPLNPGV